MIGVLRRRVMGGKAEVPEWKLYVQDGLVFQLDGTNKGATDGTWVDLVGGKVFTANNSTYIQSVEDGFLFSGEDAYNASVFNAMTSSSTLVGTRTYTMEAACSPTAWGSGRRALFIASNRACGLSLRGDFFWASGSNGRWTNSIREDQLQKVTMSFNQDIGLINGQQLTTITSGEQMSVSDAFQVGSCQNRGYNFAGTIHSIRIYSRSLSLAERLHNQQVDNERFNLGLTITT